MAWCRYSRFVWHTSASYCSSAAVLVASVQRCPRIWYIPLCAQASCTLCLSHEELDHTSPLTWSQGCPVLNARLLYSLFWIVCLRWLILLHSASSPLPMTSRKPPSNTCSSSMAFPLMLSLIGVLFTARFWFFHTANSTKDFIGGKK